MTEQQPAGPSSRPPLEVTCSRNFLHWLGGLKLSLALTTYQSRRLFLIGLKEDGGLSVFERLFDRAMGLHATSERLYMSSRYQVWRFENALAHGEIYNGYDRLFVPRLAYTTGDVDIHDMAVDNEDRVVFVNTLYSCLAGLSEQYSFTPLWTPPFISKLAPEDRCHLNGLAMVDGQPGYVTSVSRSDVTAGWRDRREAGGCVIDVRTDEIVCDGLSMPHSPRYYQGRLWLLNSGTGEFGYIDMTSGAFEPLAFCPGYLRGLAFFGNHAVVGLSRPRRDGAFSGLALDGLLEAKEAEARCGVMVIDISRGDIIHWLEFKGVVTELYDVQILPGVTRPTALGMMTDEISRVITMGSKDETGEQTRNFFLLPPEQDTNLSTETPSPEYQLRTFHGLNPDQIRRYEDFSFPSLKERWQVRPPQGSLTAINTLYQGQVIGAAVAEVQPDTISAELLSLLVVKEHRGRGVGKTLLSAMEQSLADTGCKKLEIHYRTDWTSLPVIEHLLEGRGWEAPRDKTVVFKIDIQDLAGAPWLEQSQTFEFPAGFTIFPWIELTLGERNEIIKRQEEQPWFPPEVTPFQEEDILEPLTSLGLRYQGQVVGWMITHRTGTDIIQYTSLFISPEFLRKGLARALMAESMKLQIAAGVPDFVWMVDVRNEPMMKFIDRVGRGRGRTTRGRIRYSSKQFRFDGQSPDFAEDTEIRPSRPDSGPSSVSQAPRYEIQIMDGLDQRQAETHKDFSFPSLRKRWDAKPPEGILIAANAVSEGQLTGAAVAEIRPGNETAELISLLVSPAHRRREVAAHLVSAVEKALLDRGCATLEANYRSDWPGMTAIERLLKSQGWETPRDQALVYKTTIHKLSDSPWLKEHENYVLPAGFEIFPWIEITRGEQEEMIRDQAREPWFPVAVTPFQEQDKLEPLNSLGLRHEGQVIGWLVTHRTAPDIIQYTGLFVRPEFSRLGLGRALHTQAMRIQIASDVPNMIWMVDVRNEGMLKFVDRIRTDRTTLAYLRYAYKRLS
jgi:uncharacterized protein (TIGR03032 family)